MDVSSMSFEQEHALHPGAFAGFPAASAAPLALLHRAGIFEPPARERPIGALLLCILNEIDYGLLLVSPSARPYFANQAALQECAASGAMQLHEGQVRPRDEHEHELFMRALAAAGTGKRAMLTLRGGVLPLSLALVPMPDTGLSDAEPATLLVFGKRQVCEPLSVDFFAMTHGLTTAEASVLRGLCRGQRPGEIARLAGVALSTVRSQISSIRLKTAATSIGDLIRMVTVLPPILSALNRTATPHEGFTQ
jgi:DNA-binding CsgD family transcriptional regulator